VTVIGYLPTAVLAPTAIVIADVPPPGAGIVLGLKLTVVPEGTPVADKPIPLLNPPLTVVVIVELPWVPCEMLRAEGDADTVKLGLLFPIPWLIPRKAIGVKSPLFTLLPTTTVNFVPVNVTCCVRLLPGQAAAVQVLVRAS
jgi:hypothetical protein